MPEPIYYKGMVGATNDAGVSGFQVPVRPGSRAAVCLWAAVVARQLPPEYVDWVRPDGTPIDFSKVDVKRDAPVLFFSDETPPPQPPPQQATQPQQGQGQQQQQPQQPKPQPKPQQQRQAGGQGAGEGAGEPEPMPPPEAEDSGLCQCRRCREYRAGR